MCGKASSEFTALYLLHGYEEFLCQKHGFRKNVKYPNLLLSLVDFLLILHYEKMGYA